MSISAIEKRWQIEKGAATGEYARIVQATEQKLREAGIRLLGFSHYGIAVHNLQEVVGWLAQHDSPEWTQTRQEWGKAFGCEVVRRLVEGMEIEVIRPVEPSHLRDFQIQHGEGVHHISFEVEDVEAVIATLKDKAGVEMVYPHVLNGLHGRIAFLKASDISPVNLELCQPVHHPA